MAQTMTPSAERKTMTDGQLEKAVDAYRAMLRKHRNELGSEAVQNVLSLDGYVNEQVGVLRRRVEAMSDVIVRRVKVNRGRAPHETLNATERYLYIDHHVVAEMPRGEGEEVDVYFFKVVVDLFISDADLEKQYELRGLIPADPYSLAAVNEDDPFFAEDHPNATHWKGADEEWCSAAFGRWPVVRCVFVRRRPGFDWAGYWWFAGLRK